MANHGVIFTSGAFRWAWTWHGSAPCPYVVPLLPGDEVVQLDDALAADALAAMTKGLAESPVIEAHLVKERLTVPADVRADAGEALAYRPGTRRIVSRAPDGRERPVHDFGVRGPA